MMMVLRVSYNQGGSQVGGQMLLRQQPKLAMMRKIAPFFEHKDLKAERVLRLVGGLDLKCCHSVLNSGLRDSICFGLSECIPVMNPESLSGMFDCSKGVLTSLSHRT